MCTNIKEKDGTRLFCCGAWLKDKRQRAQTETKKIPSAREKMFFTIRVTEYSMEQIVRRGCGVSFSGYILNVTSMILVTCSRLLCLKQGFGLGDSKWSLPTSATL